MQQDEYRVSKAFVHQMRILAADRNLSSIQQAVRQMREWLCDHPEDMVVGTALEEFDILEEAARIVAERSGPLPTPVS